VGCNDYSVHDVFFVGQITKQIAKYPTGEGCKLQYWLEDIT